MCRLEFIAAETLFGLKTFRRPIDLEICMRRFSSLVTFLVVLASWTLQAQAQKSRVAASYFTRANERYAKGDVDGAIADFGIAIMADSQFARAYNNRGVARERRGDLDGARSDYIKAIEIDPRLVEGYANRAKARFVRRDLDGAMADSDQAIRLNPRRAQFYNTRGAVRCERGDLDGTIADYGTAIQIDPKIAESYSNRGVVRRTIGTSTAPWLITTEAYELIPSCPTPTTIVGTCYATRGDLRRRSPISPKPSSSIQTLL